MWTHTQWIISARPGHRGSRVRGQYVCEPLCHVREIFLPLLTNLAKQIFNHSHSNEPIRKYTAWPLNPKYLHLLRSSPVQNCAQRTVSVLAHACVQPLQLQCGAMPPAKTSFRGSGSDPVCSRCPFGMRRTHSFGSGDLGQPVQKLQPNARFCQPFVCTTFLPFWASFTVILKHQSSNLQTCFNFGGHPLTAIRGVVNVFWQLEKGKLTLHISTYIKSPLPTVSQTNGL